MQENFMATKQASRLAAAATLAAPAAGLATGVLAGRKTRQKARSEGNRIKMWRGKDGAFVVVRSAKEKKAFDEKLEACLRATGRDIDALADAYEAELEKISSITRAVLMGGGGLAQKALGGAGRALGFAGQAAKNVASDILPDAARMAGKGVGGAQRAAGAVAQQAGAARAGVRRVGEQLADKSMAARANIARNYQAGLTGATPQQVQLQQALKSRQTALGKGTPKPPPTPAAAPSVAPPAVGAGGAQQAAQMVAAEGAQAAATDPSMLQQAQQALTQRYNLGALQGQPLSTQGVSQWFGRLNPQQQAELAAAMGVGAAGAGFMGGAASA